MTEPYDPDAGFGTAVAIATSTLLAVDDLDEIAAVNRIVPDIVADTFGPADDPQSWARCCYALTDLSIRLAIETARARAVDDGVSLDDVRRVLVDLVANYHRSAS